MSEAILRRFARDQWVRSHGTPRVTVLVGEGHARTMWLQWLQVGELEGQLLDGALCVATRQAAERAIADPATPIAIHCSIADLQIWRNGREDRLAAMIDEGLVEIPDEIIANRARTTRAPDRRAPPRDQLFDARSAAEAALREALDDTPSTVGRFEVNGYLPVRFGPTAAQVDLLFREDRIAVEVDGFHHFSNLDAYRRDRRKDLLLQTHGFIVIRVLAKDVMRDARPAVTEVCRALASRMGPAS